MPSNVDIEKGVHNLLINCAQLEAHETLLIICEDPDLGWYDTAAPKAVAEFAATLGVTATVLAVGEPGYDVDPAVEVAIASHDCTIYFARIGDQDRFGELPPGKRSVMIYARTIEALASTYGSASYFAFRALKNAIDDIMLAAQNIEITCPLGTRFSGKSSKKIHQKMTDVSVLRFPLGVPLPLEAAQFSGQVALTHFLTPTGSKSYLPASIILEKTTFANIKNGRISGFCGDTDQVLKIEQHYNMVADQFDIDRDAVHSWHAGIHPGVSYLASAAENPDRWSNTVFTSPKFLHFHTCGNYAPAEICWMVLDPTISIDGIKLWEGGQLQPARFPDSKVVLEQWPELNALIRNPSLSVGLDV
ncbi:MAG: hypothetical protein JKX91_03780 [Rhizobiaceae bacterium]|nr:hypothetical protein [Rhizobiaceae bacterium]